MTFLSIFSSLNSPRTRRLGKEGCWIILGQIATVAGSLVLIRVLTNYLEPAQYGRLAIGLTVAGLVNQIVMGGLSNGISRFYSVAVEKQQLTSYINNSIRLLLFATLAVSAIGTLLLGGLFFWGNLEWASLITATLIFSILDGYNGTLNGIQNAARQRAVVAFHNGVGAWLKILLAIVAILWLGKSSTAVVIGYALSSLLITCSQLFFLRTTLPQHGARDNIDFKWGKKIWSFSWPFSAWGIFTWIQLSSDRWFLDVFTSTQEVGLYAVLFQLGYTPIAMATGLAMSFLGPILYQRSGDATDLSRNTYVHRIAWKLTASSLLLTLAAVSSSLFFHDWIFQLLVSEQYRSISYLLPWVLLAGGIFASAQVLSVKLASEMKTLTMTWAKIITAILGTALILLAHT